MNKQAIKEDDQIKRIKSKFSIVGISLTMYRGKDGYIHLVKVQTPDNKEIRLDLSTINNGEVVLDSLEIGTGVTFNFKGLDIKIQSIYIINSMIDAIRTRDKTIIIENETLELISDYLIEKYIDKYPDVSIRDKVSIIDLMMTIVLEKERRRTGKNSTKAIGVYDEIKGCRNSSLRGKGIIDNYMGEYDEVMKGLLGDMGKLLRFRISDTPESYRSTMTRLYNHVKDIHREIEIACFKIDIDSLLDFNKLYGL
jgi:hypothetical protein